MPLSPYLFTVTVPTRLPIINVRWANCSIKSAGEMPKSAQDKAENCPNALDTAIAHANVRTEATS